ncbi:MAG TPA: D-Ala-D-Ala carboxypeptidase family metallohydrolase [Thermoanaerobaculia bacterium]|nr:D-Ala-D-Ala carboxypeptidase family metallohydrolase [Thermoanaerobaculia bacterium]
MPRRTSARLLSVLVLAAAVACGESGRGAGSAVPAPEAVGDPDERLAEEGEVPVTDEDDCGFDTELHADGAAGEPTDAPQPVSFALEFADEVNPHPLMSASVMPGETLELEPVLADPIRRFRVEADAGRLEPAGAGRWRWTAPQEPGFHCLRVIDESRDETMCLNAFVLTPWDGAETLNGYRIGSYPSKLYKGLEVYRAPRGFIEVTEENRDTWVSPHFQLKQFVCKQESGYPKYVVLRTRMLLKLERLLAEVKERGLPVDTFYVMSAYRTPFYNRAIGNDTSFSRHAFGDAADIFVDRNRNGMMDDLDGSGSVTVEDARVLVRVVDELAQEPWYRPFVGGLGLYGPAPHRGPFIHLDTRGFQARW